MEEIYKKLAICKKNLNLAREALEAGYYESARILLEDARKSLSPNPDLRLFPTLSDSQPENAGVRLASFKKVLAKIASATRKELTQAKESYAPAKCYPFKPAFFARLNMYLAPADPCYGEEADNLLVDMIIPEQALIDNNPISSSFYEYIITNAFPRISQYDFLRLDSIWVDLYIKLSLSLPIENIDCNRIIYNIFCSKSSLREDKLLKKVNFIINLLNTIKRADLLDKYRNIVIALDSLICSNEVDSEQSSKLYNRSENETEESVYNLNRTMEKAETLIAPLIGSEKEIIAARSCSEDAFLSDWNNPTIDIIRLWSNERASGQKLNLPIAEMRNISGDFLCDGEDWSELPRHKNICYLAHGALYDCGLPLAAIPAIDQASFSIVFCRQLCARLDPDTQEFLAPFPYPHREMAGKD